ncbi:MAG: hypothetical protein J0M12_04845 [Deltaproteobacteria bacterium]|nr:hypothetical protein [Deltaproteobacteria bacterium]
MASVILIENGADQATVQRAVAELPEASRESLTIVANTMPTGLTSGQTFISTATNSLSEALQQALTRAKSDTVLFIDARMTPSSAVISALAQEINSGNSGFTYAALESRGETMTLGEVEADSIVSLLGSTKSWPLMCVAAKKSVIDACGRLEGENMTELMLKTMIEALAEGEAVTQSSQSLQSASTAAARNMSEISAAATARCLHRAIESINIEELFPHHAWEAHREESAAASYHTLAAMFIRLGDSESALECLTLGDQFEDSPRSLALKGLIALDRGETLTAVANMVSSLQQYELRKKQNSNHYVHFAPRDLASINSNLNAGLEALNKRDNSAALEFFATAVFSFDPFFSEHGVNALKAAGH